MENKWQEIETAPKDGTRILSFGCLHGDRGVDMGEKPMAQVSRYMDSFNCWYSAEWGSHSPTHWMPLPEPPKDTP